MKLFLKLLSVSIRSQMQYRASFVMLTIAHFVGTIISIIGVWVLFDRFHMVEGWTFQEVAVIYGIIHIAFSIAESAARGFDTFDEMIKHGNFDRILLRPQSTLFQIAASHLQLMRIGRFVQGLLVLMWAMQGLDISLGMVLLSIFSSASIFYGIYILQATLAFWTTESLEIVNIVSYGGVEACQYPLTLYPKGFVLFFTVLIPIACAIYYPIATLLGHESLPNGVVVLLPLAGFLFLYLCCKIWHLGVRHYTSTGS